MGPHTSTTTPLTRSSRTRPRPRWTVTLTCPRPANRAADDFHLAQHRIDGTVRRLLGRDAQLTLTPNQVRLVRKSTTAPDLARWQEELALVLSCLSVRETAERVGCSPRTVLRVRARQCGGTTPPTNS